MSARYWCRVCAQPVRRVPDTYRWVHVALNVDHGPIPTTQRPESVA